MTSSVNPVAVLDEYRDRFSEAYVTVRGPSVGGTRYEVEREIDTRIAAELIKAQAARVIKTGIPCGLRKTAGAWMCSAGRMR